MIRLINGRGQLGEVLKKGVQEETNLEIIIYHTWNFLDKSEETQKECYERFKKFVDEHSEETIIFISTYSQTYNPYNFYKKIAEDYLSENTKNGRSIRLPTLIGKGVCEDFREEKINPWGEMEIMTIENAAKIILDFAKSNSRERIFRAKGIIVPATMVKELILFGQKDIKEMQDYTQLTEHQRRFNPSTKLAMHEEFARYLKGKFVMPINIEISPVGHCNANCPWCFYVNTKNNEILQKEIVYKLIEEISGKVKAISWTGGGEPTLHPAFASFVEKTSEAGINQGLFTNALVKPSYDPAKFEWIRVSKTNKEWNIENLRILRQCKTLGMCINYEGDEEEIKEALRIGKLVGVDYLQVRPALKLNGNKVSVKIPSIQDELLSVTEYKFRESSTNKTYDKCEGYHFVPFIWQDGNVDVCGYIKDREGGNLGNLYKESFESIMRRAPQHIDVTKNCQICCKNHEINKAIYEARRIENIEFV